MLSTRPENTKHIHDMFKGGMNSLQMLKCLRNITKTL